MLLVGCLSEITELGDGSVHATATLAPGRSGPRAAQIDPAILRAAAAEFFSSAPLLLEQFASPAGTGAGGVVDLVVTDEGAIDVTFKVTGETAAKKVVTGVYKSGALALRVTARDATGAVAKAQIYAASLIDREDEPAFLAKAMSSGGSAYDAFALIHGLEHSLHSLEYSLLDIGARLTRYEYLRR